MNNLETIEKRLAEIKIEVEKEDADIEKLSVEADELIEQRKQVKEQIEKRNETLNKLANGEIGSVVTIEQRGGTDNMEFVKDTVLETKEYRSAWLKNLRKLELNEVEKRAFTVANSNVIPVELQNEIIAKVKTIAPILNRVTLLNVKGGVRFSVEGDIADAQLHTENGTITADGDTMIDVYLSAYEITKLIQVSASVENMALDAFANWIVDAIADKVAKKASMYLINGTGVSQPTGLNTITWGTTNSVTVAKDSTLSASNVLGLIALLPTDFDAYATFTMSKKTLFTDFMPLQDASKNKLVTYENGKYYVYGYEVDLDDNVAYHEAFLGDMKKLVANMSGAVDVKSDFDIRSNSYLYLGACEFDSKVAMNKAFVKLVKATA